MQEIKIKRPLAGDTVASALAEQSSHFVNAVRNRAYELFDTDERKSGGELDHWLFAEGEVLRPLKVDVKQEASEYVISLLVSGYGSKDLNVYLLPESLVVTGKLAETISKHGGTSTEQRRSIFYQWTYPAHINIDGIKAVLLGSSLIMDIPKGEPTPILAMEERLASEQALVASA